MKNPRVAEALEWLEKRSSKSARDSMTRYAIPNDTALGVRMGDIQKLARSLGRDHALARRLAARAEPAARWVGKDVLRDLGRKLQ